MDAEKGHPIVASVEAIQGTCNAGHCVGDEFAVSARNTGGMCGYLYHAAFPYLIMLQFGGSLPWGIADEVKLQCPDRENLLTIKLRRVH